MTTSTDVLNVARAHLGERESPDGSNHTEFGQWYGMDGVAWCAEFVSFCLTRGGFNDGADHTAIPGVHTSTSKGWAYVPSIVADATNAGRFDRTPRAGDVVCFYWGGGEQNSHTGLVESVNADGSFNTIEGNEANQVERQHRPLDGLVKGFFHPPYSTTAPTPVSEEESDPMVLISTASQAGQYVVIGGTVFGLEDGESAQAFVKAGAKTVQVSAKEFGHFAARAV